MILRPVASAFARAAARLDAGYHLAPGQVAAASLVAARAAGVPVRRIGEVAESVVLPPNASPSSVFPDDPFSQSG